MRRQKTYRLCEIVQFNPTERLAKGTIAKKVAMENLHPFTRAISGYELTAYSGGSKFRNGDTLMARITPCLENGKTAYVSILDDEEVGFGSTEYIVFRNIEGVTDRKFIYYFVSNPWFRNIAIKSMVGSSGRQRVQQSVLENLEISLPPLAEQKRIASILGALDDKIELNRRINANLEEQAQALFKSWFVDFEPFNGVLPNNWNVKLLGEVCSCELGGTPNRNTSEYWEGNIPWINSGEINQFRITKPSEMISELGLKKSATKLLPPKTTVLAITGATLGQVSLLEIASCANQSVVGIKPNEFIPYEYIYPYIKTNIDKLISCQTGGAQQHINKQNIEKLSILLPDKETMKKYVNTVSGIYALIANKCFENKYLTSLRDALLSRLISGEIMDRK